MAYSLTREALLLDLYAAFLCAKRHKGSKLYVQRFEQHLKENLNELRDSLWDRTYKPAPSSCFIIERPKKREVCIFYSNAASCRFSEAINSALSDGVFDSSG